MINEIRELRSLDTIAIFVIVFWTVIFSMIIYLIFGMALPDVVKIFVGGLIAEWLLVKCYLNGLNSVKLEKAILLLTLFFLFGPMLAYVGIGLIIISLEKAEIMDPKLVMVFFIIAMIIPYLIVGATSIMRSIRQRLKKVGDRIRLSLSLSTALVTIMYAITPLLSFDGIIIDSIQFVFFIPFALNILGICFIEYIAMREKEIKRVNQYDV